MFWGNKISIKFSLLNLFVLLFHTTLAQVLNQEEFSVINGLPSNEIRCIHKDSKGYLWFGTIYGLAKYNGNNFVEYKHQSTENSISGDVISTIYEDSNGNILVGANGLSILNRKTGKWKNYLHNPSNKFSISHPSVLSIIQENDSVYWVTTNKGVDKFNIITGKFEPSNFIPFKVASQIKLLKVDANKNITLLSPLFYFTFDFKSKTYFSLPLNNVETSNTIIFNENIVGIRQTGLDRFILFRKVLHNKKEFTIQTLEDNNCILLHEAESFSLVCRNKILTYNSKFKLVNTVFFQPQKNKSEFLCGLKESNGTIWIGTSNGLIKIQPKSPFQIIDVNNGLPNEYVRSLEVDDDKLLVGVRQGAIYQMANVDSLLFSIKHKANRIAYPTKNGEVYATNQILSLKNKDLLFVTKDALFLYSKAKKTFCDQFKIKANNQLFSAVEADNGILVGSLVSPSLFKVKTISNKIILDTSFSVVNPPEVVYTLLKTHKNEVLIGGEGLFRLQFNTKINSYVADTLIPSINGSNFINNSVWDILEIDSTRLFACTTTNGVYIYNRATKELVHFSKSNGLPSDFDCAAIKGNDNKVWITTKEGLCSIDLSNLKIKKYLVKKSGVNCDFNFKCAAKTKNNTLLFGSKQGIICFNPDSILHENSSYPLLINEFRVFEKVVRRELKDNDTIRLNYDENFFSIEFSLLDFQNPKDIQYRYQLIKYDKEERTVPFGKNSVSFTDVPPGKYRFNLTSIDYKGNQQTLSLRIIINPAFYQKTLFKFLVVLLIIFFIGSIILLYVRRKILHSKLYKLELDLLRNQINPHFIFNTLTSIQHTILLNSKDEGAYQLSKFSKLMRMCLDYSRLYNS